ncbi:MULTISPECIES: hypothetical protein [Halorussus]|uniref:hypothetical protein n=1 Tax=Halorussus TaxID=1070314 RepID=UPI0020A11B20|nr:hypothetical protein [Halorussus vallis]USZ75019.1 hypothetical protein NGM07_16465 [Halorussus vallis]
MLLRPKPDWTLKADLRRRKLEKGEESFLGRVVESLFVPNSPTEETTAQTQPVTPENQRRLDELDEKETRHCFSVNVRAVATARDPAAASSAVGSLSTALEPIGHSCYQLAVETNEAAPRDAESNRTNALGTLDAIRDREFHEMQTGFWTRLPGRGTGSPEIIAAPDEVPNFCLLGGAGLTSNAKRALDLTPGERTAVPRPPSEHLEPYLVPGLTLGRPLTQDNAPDTELLSLPPALQPLHVAWFGKTGSGKSTSLIRAMLDNHVANDGPSILIDRKGDGMPIEYLRAHYATYGTLENIYFFDCAEVLPALSFFDIRPQLAVGVDRATAVQDVVDHYIELLIGIMGRNRFERAVRSPDIIRYLVKALFDPVHGSDAFSHRDLQRTAMRMADTQDAPPVSDEDLAVLLGGVVTTSQRSFVEVMQGVLNRIEKVPLDDRLAELFNHVPDGGDETDSQFDFFDVLEENAVVLMDTSGLRTESRRALTLVVLSNLWTALRRRKHLHTKRGASRTDSETGEETQDPSLVNLYIEEAADVAASGLMTDLLAQSRGFSLSVTLAMQFPAQVRNADTEAYAEILNNISTIVTGNVAVDADLERRLATEGMPPSEVGNRLRALRRGQWFATLPAGFNDPEPRPFLLESAPLPAGHPEGDAPLSETQALAFDALVDVVRDQTRLEAGLDMLGDEPPTNTDVQNEVSESSSPSTERVDSALPYTKRLPVCIRYDEAVHAIVCTGCESRHDPSFAGVKRGVECCSSLERIDRKDFPISSTNLMLSAREREESEYSDRQLAFLQAVHSAHQGEYDPEWEYDICWDDMTRLQEYVGIEAEEVQDLLDDDLLTLDCTHPHRLYTVTAEGRNEIQVAYREGLAYGHGVGDLGESSLHRVMVEFGRRYVEEAYANDAESDVVEVVPYYELDDGHRLDVAGLDVDGTIRAVLEAERVNHDVLRAVPEDYDKMAAFDPEDAIWVVKNRDAAHDVLEALNDPPTGEIRVEKTYSRSSPPRAFRLDAPGCSQIHTLQYLRDTVLELEPPN